MMYGVALQTLTTMVILQEDLLEEKVLYWLLEEVLSVLVRSYSDQV